MLIECSNIKKSFQGIDLLKDISFKVDDHDKIAIIGVNGAGKTTILNILIGEESYDSGDLFKSRDLNVGYLKQHHDLDMNKTIYECALEVFEPLIKIENRMRELEGIMAYDHSDQVMNEYDSLTNRFNEKDGFSYPSRIVGVLKGMGFVEEDFQKYVYELSGGQKTRLCLAKLLLEEPKLLVLDEPTNHLDSQAISFLENYLKGYKNALIVVSHDRYFIDVVSNKIIEIENGKSHSYNCRYEEYSIQKRTQRAIDLKHYINQQKEIKKIQTQLKITIDISYNNVIIERENNSFYKINMSNKYIEMYQNMSALKKDEWLSKKQKNEKMKFKDAYTITKNEKYKEDINKIDIQELNKKNYLDAA